ncbi:hypothetical protein DFP72DRAFT_1177189 [Ephemerocybe angulata]|uniref:DUF6589 domain-containing protein n=1 Tax=Ephemerocybe angulata TaxID=980116 RepID=A0A8H6HCE0_9AGAR|nr:hypothetical protein DFP72DRAFT_1177189 [Tulosesus angulatus]
MDPKLQCDALRNWLVNLTGRKNGFKEIDMLQEHHNFWLKVRQMTWTLKQTGWTSR